MNLKSSDIDGIGKKLDELIEVVNGGRGSGNFNPGQGRGVGKPGNGMSTKSDKMLHDTVKQMADIFSTMNKREGYKYSSSEDLVLKQGKFFTPEKKPDDIKLGPKKECFANAAKLALERSNLTYVEGYAMVNDRLPLPIAHAWCVDKKGRVIDNTWENPGVAYFGVPFKTGYLAKKLSETGVYGILSGSVGSSDFLKDGVPSEGIANIKKQKNAIVMNGGEGSGNFGHKGRIGKVGGSSKDGSGGKAEFSELLSKDAKKVLGEINEYSEGAYFKEINSVLDDFSKLGVDVKKVKFETNIDKLPEKMRKQITDSTEGMISAKKNLEAVIYLDETKQSEYGLGGENKFLEGREPKDQPWATNNSPIGILRHELGHLAAYTVFMNSRGRKGTAGPILAGAVNLETHANFKKIFGEGYALNRLKLSRYGMKDSGEAVAESFANPNFSSDTKKIYDFYVNELRKKAQNNAVEDDGWLVLCLGFTTKDPLSNKVNQLIHKINEVTGKRGNPYHDKEGKFTTGPSGKKSEGGESLRIRMDGEEYTGEEFKKKTQEQNEAYVLDEISDNYKDLAGLEKRVMENKGWNVYEEGGQTYGELGAKVTKQALSLGKDDVQVMNNGKKYLEDNNNEFYRSKATDSDGLAVYTTDSHDSALDYADGNEKAICYLVVNKSNFIKQADVDKIRSKLIKKSKSEGLKEALKKTNKSAQVKDTIIAGLLGYDGIIRPTNDAGTEYIVINADLLRLDKTGKIKGRNTVKLSKKESEELKNKLYILESFLNGGKGSGNFNPGQGRGVGKPNSKVSFSENVKKKTNDYLDKAITVEEDEILNEQYLVSNLRVFGDNPSYEFLKENNVSEETIDKCKELLKKHVGQQDYQVSGDNEILENIKNNTEVGKAFKLNAQYQNFLVKEIENRVSKLEKEARENENADYSRLNVRTAKDGTLSLYRIGKAGNKDIESYAYSEDSSFLEGGGYSRYSRKDVENNGYEIFAGLCDGFYKDSAQQFNMYSEYEIITIKKDLLK